MPKRQRRPNAKEPTRTLPTPGPLLAPRRPPTPESVVEDLIEQTPGVSAPHPQASPQRLAPIEGPVRILFMDLDGTLTNGLITFDAHGDQRHFGIRDG